MTQIGNNNATLPYCHQQSKPADRRTHTYHAHVVNRNQCRMPSVIIEYYSSITALGNVNSCLLMVMCASGTSAILRVWKLKPWLPQGRRVDTHSL